MANHFKELASRLEAVSALIRTGCIWKVTENCLEELRLPFRQAHHDFAFCNAVKGLGEAACINHDTRRIADMLRLRSEAFLQECHAGAVELLIPFRHAQRVFGVVMCGPFRSGENGQRPPPIGNCRCGGPNSVRRWKSWSGFLCRDCSMNCTRCAPNCCRSRSGMRGFSRYWSF